MLSFDRSLLHIWHKVGRAWCLSYPRLLVEFVLSTKMYWLLINVYWFYAVKFYWDKGLNENDMCGAQIYEWGPTVSVCKINDLGSTRCVCVCAKNCVDGTDQSDHKLLVCIGRRNCTFHLLFCPGGISTWTAQWSLVISRRRGRGEYNFKFIAHRHIVKGSQEFAALKFHDRSARFKKDITGSQEHTDCEMTGT